MVIGDGHTYQWLLLGGIILAVLSMGPGVAQAGETLEYDNLSVSPTDVEPTESVDVTATVTNTADNETPYEAPLLINGSETAWENGTLDANTSEAISFNYTFDEQGTYEVVIGDLDPVPVAVETQSLAIQAVEVPEATVVGDELEASIAVRNDGPTNLTENATLELADDTMERRSVTVPANTTENATISTTVPAEAVPNTTVSVGLDTDEIDETLVVSEDPITYDSLSVSDPHVVPFDDITVNATVSNLGQEPSDYEAPLTVDGEAHAWANGTLEGDESTTVTLEAALQSGEYNLTIGDLDPEPVTVANYGPINVSFEDLPDNSTVNETSTLRFELTNMGDDRAVESIAVSANDEVIHEETVLLEASESRIEEVAYRPAVADWPSAELRVESLFHTDEERLTVTGPTDDGGVLALTDVEMPYTSFGSAVPENLSVDATIENIGREATNQTVALEVDDEVTDEGNVSLGPEEYTTERLELPFQGGEVSVTVETDDQTKTVTEEISAGGIRPPSPDITVSSVELATDTVDSESPILVDVTLTNDGDGSGDRTIELEVNDEVVQMEIAAVGPGETETIELTYTPEDVGSYTVAAEGEEWTVDVTEPDADDSDDEDPPERADGESDSDEESDDDEEEDDDRLPAGPLGPVIIILAVAVALSRRA